MARRHKRPPRENGDDHALVACQNPQAPRRRNENVLPATAIRSIQALSWLGMPKLYMGAPITTTSAPRNSSSTVSLAAISLWIAGDSGTMP